MYPEAHIRAAQATRDEALCQEFIAMCQWIIENSQDPRRVAWAQEELKYYQLRAESSRGIAALPI